MINNKLQSNYAFYFSSKHKINTYVLMYLFKCSMALSMSFLALYNVTSLFLAICNRKKFILE